jgi:predicted nucleotidyltransferase
MRFSDSQLQKLKDYFSHQPVHKAWLFGSVARGESNHESDVDILIDLDYSARIGLRYIQMKLDLEQMLGKKVDLVTLKSMNKRLGQIIANEKVLIYERP